MRPDDERALRALLLKQTDEVLIREVMRVYGDSHATVKQEIAHYGRVSVCDRLIGHYRRVNTGELTARLMKRLRARSQAASQPAEPVE